MKAACTTTVFIHDNSVLLGRDGMGMTTVMRGIALGALAPVLEGGTAPSLVSYVRQMDTGALELSEIHRGG
jgi:hypothetical protein